VITADAVEKDSAWMETLRWDVIVRTLGKAYVLTATGQHAANISVMQMVRNLSGVIARYAAVAVGRMARAPNMLWHKPQGKTTLSLASTALSVESPVYTV